MCVGKGRWHIHLAADDFDVGPCFAGARGLHRLVELAKRGYTRCIPVSASERLRQFGVVPRREVVVSPVRVLFQRTLNEIAAIVEDEDDDVCSEPSHSADIVRGQLMRAFAGDQNGAPVRIGKRDAERGRRRPTD